MSPVDDGGGRSRSANPGGEVGSLAHAIDVLTGRGYAASFRAVAGGLRDTGTDRVYRPEECAIDETLRFEGQSDPDDQAIVFALRCGDGVKGTYAVAYGPGMAPLDADMVRRLGAARD